MEGVTRDRLGHVVKTAIYYLGSAWVFIEAINFVTDKYGLHTRWLDVIILLAIFGLPASVIYSWFNGQFNRKAIILHLLNSVITMSVVIYDLVIPNVLHPTELRILRFKQNKQMLTKELRSLVILPIANYTGDDSKEHMILGMHDALIKELGKLEALRVVSKTSSLSYAGSQKTLGQIATELGVDGVIEASVYRMDDEIHMSLQLINAFPEEQPLWSKSYQADMSGALILYSEVVKNIAVEIHISLNLREEENLSNRREVDSEAYRDYLTGMGHLYRLTESSLNRAQQYFELAIEKDPEYVPAHLGIALVWGFRRQQGLVSDEVARKERKAVFAKTMELDSTLMEVQYSTALYSAWGLWQWEEAELAFERTLDMDPNHAEARIYYAWFLNVMKRSKEAQEQADKAMQLQPYSGLVQSLYGMHLNHTRQFEKALLHLSKALEEDPENITARSTLWTIHHNMGNFDEAIKWAESVYTLKKEAEVAAILKSGYSEGGYQLAMKQVAEAYILKSDTVYVTPWQIATLYTRAGDRDLAIEWLYKAFEEHDANMPSISPDPIFDPLRGDKRFQELLMKMNLPI